MLRGWRRCWSIVKFAARASARSSSRSELSGSSRKGLLPTRMSDVQVWRNRQLYNPVRGIRNSHYRRSRLAKRDRAITVDLRQFSRSLVVQIDAVLPRVMIGQRRAFSGGCGVLRNGIRTETLRGDQRGTEHRRRA